MTLSNRHTARHAAPRAPYASPPSTTAAAAAASSRERGERTPRALERAELALLAAVVLALAAYGGWGLGARVAEIDRPVAAAASPPRPAVELRPADIAPLPLATTPATAQTSTLSPADDIQPATPAGHEVAAKANELPAPERGGLPMPVLGADPADLRDDFHDTRGGRGDHDAIDILAPRHTPVVAVDDGTIAKLFVSERGGLTIYQFDPTESYCYYYAHLEGYALNLREGQRVIRGQVIGYVGTSGNAPKDTPHLHFSVNRLGAEKRWWETTPVNPFPLLRAGGSTPGVDDAH